MIIEEAPPRAPAEAGGAAGGLRVPLLDVGLITWPVSGRTAAGLAAQAGRLAAHLAARPGLEAADVGWSLAATRSVFEHRAVVTGGDRAGLAAGLAAVAAGQPGPGVVTGAVPAGGPGRVALVFPGQGAQWAGMGAELASCCPVFAARLAECAAALAPHVDWDLREVIAGAPGAPGLEAAEVAQPALWAVMVSLAAVWQAAGITPDAVVGHSQGEIAAATVAGILSLEDAARVVAVRSRALSGLDAAGGMISVVMPEPAVRELLARWDGRLSVAAVNGPAATVVSGEPGALAELEAELSARHVLRWPVPASDFIAHSPGVEALAAALARELAPVRPAAGQVPLFSTVRREWADGTGLDAGYWYDNLRQTVRFADSVRALAAEGYRVFIEASPHPVLTAAVTETIQDAAGDADAVITGTLDRADAGARRLLSVLARVHVQGTRVNWAAVLGQGQRVDLPTYAFQRQRYWPEQAARIPAAGTGRSVTETCGTRSPGCRSAEPGAAVLPGTWLVVVPAGQARRTGPVGACGRWNPAAARWWSSRPARASRTGPRWRHGSARLDGAEPAGVLSLLAAGRGAAARPPGGARRAGRARRRWCRRWATPGSSAPLWAVTCGAVAAGAGEVLTSPVQAMAWGLGRVAGLEHPDRWGGLVDVPPVLDERAAARLCGVLAGCGEDQVAIRAAGILARRLVRAPLPRQPAGRGCRAGRCW